MKKYSNVIKISVICLLAILLPLSACAAGKTEKIPAQADSYRPILESQNPEIAKILTAYQVDPEQRNFSWSVTPLEKNDFSTTFSLTYPSPCKKSTEFNQTVWCEYIRANHKGPRPAVIILHAITVNSFNFQRKVGYHFASKGMDSLLIKLPFHGNRRDPQMKPTAMLLADPRIIITAFRQGAMDIRRGARFLAEQEGVDKDKIYIVGHSLGGIIGALTLGVDGGFPKAAITIGGADIAQLVDSHCKMFPLLQLLFQQHNLTGEVLKQLLVPVEPLTFASRAGKTQVLMLNAKKDIIVPVAGSKKLAAELPNAKVVWNNETHASFDMRYFKYLPEITKFLLKDDNTEDSQ